MQATFNTSIGNIVCELYPDQAPITVGNFAGLAEGSKEWTDPKTSQTMTTPLYSDTIFHRVIPDFMIQGGDPLGLGTGGPGYEFEDECHPDLSFDQPGRLAMANAGLGTNECWNMTRSPTKKSIPTSAGLGPASAGLRLPTSAGLGHPTRAGLGSQRHFIC